MNTFLPKDPIIVIALGPWHNSKGWIIEYAGKDTYRVSVQTKGGFGQILPFHRDELIKDVKS